MVTILGQSSQITSANSSAASFSFLRPTVLSVQPRSFGTLPGSQEITVRGIALGVDDLLASTAIVFGNAADNTRSGLIVPTSAVLLPGGQQQLTFRLPEGVGKILLAAGQGRQTGLAFPPHGRVEAQHGESMALKCCPHGGGRLGIGKLQFHRREPRRLGGPDALQ